MRRQRVQLHAERTPLAPGLARGAVASACDDWGLAEIRVPALLVTSELVTNAVLHGSGEIDVEAMLRDDFLHIRVRDGSPAPPVLVPPAEPPELADHGRGLHFIDHHSTAWGHLIEPDHAGKVVWATLRIRPAGD